MSYASNYSYEKRKSDSQVIHILLLNPKNYKIDLVKANKDRGRETVADIAKRQQAEIAINGGFFEISAIKGKDGMPTGTLIINGHVYRIKNISQALVMIKSNSLSILQDNPKKYIANNVSIVSGIPLLISDGEIPLTIKNKKSDFYKGAHARTAIGIKSDGSIVIVVAEHHYGIGESVDGLSILQLAKLMQSLGCKYAINLDGGGSSTLYIKDKVVNHTIGDSDENNGLQIVRPVSDAIIFKN